MSPLQKNRLETSSIFQRTKPSNGNRSRKERAIYYFAAHQGNTITQIYEPSAHWIRIPIDSYLVIPTSTWNEWSISLSWELYTISLWSSLGGHHAICEWDTTSLSRAPVIATYYYIKSLGSNTLHNLEETELMVTVFIDTFLIRAHRQNGLVFFLKLLNRFRYYVE